MASTGLHHGKALLKHKKPQFGGLEMGLTFICLFMSGVTNVYDRHSYDKEKQEALNAWGVRLAPERPEIGRD